MRLSIVTDTFPPDVNGVALTLRRIQVELTRRGHEVTVLMPYQLYEEGLKDATVRVRAGEAVSKHVPEPPITIQALPLPGYKGLRFGLPSKQLLVPLWKKPSSRPDMVYVATESPLGFSAVQAARKLGIPAVSGFHTNFHTYMADYNLAMLEDMAADYLRMVHNQTLATFAPSPDVIAQLEHDGFQNVRLLGRGVDTERFTPDARDMQLRSEWGAAENDPVMIYVGRVAPEKNLPLFFDAFAAVREKFPTAKAVVVGSGPKLADYEKAHPNIFFAGVRRDSDLARHYASADLFIFPSTTETFGNVILEGMASGLVAVAYNYAAGKSHLVHGVNGYAPEFNNNEAFIESTLEAFGRAFDQKLRDKAREKARELSWSAVIDQFLEDLDDIAENWKYSGESAEKVASKTD